MLLFSILGKNSLNFIVGKSHRLDVLSYAAMFADADYLTVRYFINRTGVFYDILFRPDKFKEGREVYYNSEIGPGFNFGKSMPSLYLMDMREPWMFDADFKEEYRISQTYDSLQSILFEYGYLKHNYSTE
ncbi:MAG: hypothetical protein HeimC3_34580 [Candidatus Heimdallarchaeota archaeon LC_3]|nr:MAG: hypothetical protein HeimC3_34580 [Candidatus Heimdallarchaeota archaeon LC_3]